MIKTTTMKAVSALIETKKEIAQELLEELKDPMTAHHVTVDDEGKPVHHHVGIIVDKDNKPRVHLQFGWNDDHEKQIILAKVALLFGADMKAEALIMAMDSRVHVLDEDQIDEWKEVDASDAFIFPVLEITKEDEDWKAETDLFGQYYVYKGDGIRFKPIDMDGWGKEASKSPTMDLMEEISLAARRRTPSYNPFTGGENRIDDLSDVEILLYSLDILLESENLHVHPSKEFLAEAVDDIKAEFERRGEELSDNPELGEALQGILSLMEHVDQVEAEIDEDDDPPIISSMPWG